MERYFKELKIYFITVALLFFAAVWIGYFITTLSPEEFRYVERELSDIKGFLSDFSLLSLFFLIFLNNAFKIFFAIILGVGFGIFPIFFVFANGYFIGSTAFVAGEMIGWTPFFVAIAPHGVIEIPVFFLGSAIGCMVGIKAFKNVFGKGEYKIKKEMFYGLRIFFRLILPSLFVASFVEVFVTPTIIGFVL